MDDAVDHESSTDGALPPSPTDAVQDASYIPRPPNAFILFRSHFIRSNRIPGRVEGNHSTLSQIIGAVWRKLPTQEREHWEAKAQVALEEHKRRYPDWRFVNAQVRRGRGREGDARGRRGRGRGKRRKTEGERVEMIRDLLVEGVEGEHLEKAVDDWEKSKRTVLKPSSSRLPPPPASPYADNPYAAAVQPLPVPPSPYPVSNFSTLVNWAGDAPSSAYTYSEFNNTEFHHNTYYEPTTYLSPYPAYESAETHYVPLEPALPPSPPGERFVWTEPWRSPTPPNRKGKHRATNVDQHGWEVILPPQNSDPQ